MQAVGRVAGLYRHPVKSMAGEALSALDLDERGVVADRGLAVRTEDGKFGSGKSTRRFTRLDGLLEWRARTRAGTVEVAAPGEGYRRFDDPSVAASLSSQLGRRVSLTPEADVSHLDAGPVHLVTTSALAWLRDLEGGAPVDVRRLRPNLLIDSGEGHSGRPLEDDFVGARVAIGRVELEVVGRTERCRMIGLAQGDLDEAPSLLPRLARATRGHFGVYARVVRTGSIRLGDAVHVI